MPDFLKELGLAAARSTRSTRTPSSRNWFRPRASGWRWTGSICSTMVLMGINRLIVTDGDIKAKVLFQLDTVDKVDRKAATQTTELRATRTRTRAKESAGWFSPATVNAGLRHQTSASTTKKSMRRRRRSTCTRNSRARSTSTSGARPSRSTRWRTSSVSTTSAPAGGLGQPSRSAPGGWRRRPRVPPSRPLRRLPGAPGLTTTARHVDSRARNRHSPARLVGATPAR